MEYASNGKGNLGVTLGAVGTGLALLNGSGGGCGNGGILGGLFGGGNKNTSCNNEQCYATNEVVDLKSELAKERSERYTDTIAISTYKDAVSFAKENDSKIASVVKDLAVYVAANDVKAARTEEQIHCLDTTLNRRIDCAKQECASAIALESERRMCGDQNIMSYVQATYVPGKLIMPASSICPPVRTKCNYDTPTSNIGSTHE